MILPAEGFVLQVQKEDDLTLDMMHSLLSNPIRRQSFACVKSLAVSTAAAWRCRLSLLTWLLLGQKLNLRKKPVLQMFSKIYQVHFFSNFPSKSINNIIILLCRREPMALSLDMTHMPPQLYSFFSNKR